MRAPRQAQANNRCRWLQHHNSEDAGHDVARSEGIDSSVAHHATGTENIENCAKELQTHCKCQDVTHPQVGEAALQQTTVNTEQETYRRNAEHLQDCRNGTEKGARALAKPEVRCDAVR